MISRMIPERGLTAIIALAAMGATLLAAGCGELEPAAGTGCAANVAQIEVQENFYRIGCGCQEAVGTRAGANGSLTCTVAAGTRVVFLFTAIATQHQVASQGTPSFASSALFNPESPVVNHAHGVELSAAGTYAFSDPFLPTFSGRIIAQ